MLLYDGDLTGRPVSSTSTTYEGAAFGWMDNAVCLGYQAALVSLDSPTYGRLWLSVRPHPGDTVSCHQIGAMVRGGAAGPMDQMLSGMDKEIGVDSGLGCDPKKVSE